MERGYFSLAAGTKQNTILRRILILTWHCIRYKTIQLLTIKEVTWSMVNVRRGNRCVMYWGKNRNMCFWERERERERERGGVTLLVKHVITPSTPSTTPHSTRTWDPQQAACVHWCRKIAIGLYKYICITQRRSYHQARRKLRNGSVMVSSITFYKHAQWVTHFPKKGAEEEAWRLFLNGLQADC